MRSRSRAGALKLGAVAAVLGAAIVAVILATAGSNGPPRHAVATQPTPVSVWVHAGHQRAPVPPGFLGLSFELASAEQISRYAYSGNFAALLRSLGPGVLRFGGASADTRVAWTDADTPRPAWASSVLNPGDLARLARLAAATRWHVLLTLGLVHYDPRAAAREVAAAKAALGPWLLGIEVGNEPDSYAVHGLRRNPWEYAQYSAEVDGYRNAIAAVTPGVAVAGPGVSGSSAFKRWGPQEALTQKPALLTGHHYPLGCRSERESTIPRLLSQSTRGREIQSLRRYLSLARASAIPLRIDETNSVSCGGRAGVSNTFAAALWAVNYIAQTMAAGAAGINFEGNPATCEGYSPVCAPTHARLLSGALHPQPEWYALLLTRGLVGDRPLQTTVTPRKRANLAVTALLGPHGALRLVLVDDDPPGSSAAVLRLHVGRRYGVANVLRLTAPSLRATSGVKLGGRAVAADGYWQRPRRLAQLPLRSGVVTVSVPAASAALVTVFPAEGVSAGRPPARPTGSCARTACASGRRGRRATPRQSAAQTG
jgi:hypothetical protein